MLTLMLLEPERPKTKIWGAGQGCNVLFLSCQPCSLVYLLFLSPNRGMGWLELESFPPHSSESSI